MLSGREQELAGRLREAASQVIGSDHDEDDEGDDDDGDDEGDVGDDGDEMILKLHFLTFMKKSSRVTRAWC